MHLLDLPHTHTRTDLRSSCLFHFSTLNQQTVLCLASHITDTLKRIYTEFCVDIVLAIFSKRFENQVEIQTHTDLYAIESCYTSSHLTFVIWISIFSSSNFQMFNLQKD